MNDDRRAETYYLGKNGHGSIFMALFPKEQHRRIERRAPIKADRSSCLSVPCLHTFARHFLIRVHHRESDSPRSKSVTSVP